MYYTESNLMRTCNLCKETSENFYRGGTRCKKCVQQKSKVWYQENKERAKETVRRWRTANPERHAALIENSRLKRFYGITLNDYNEMVKKQNGQCAICLQKGKLHVDHCHETGRVRGLLCTKHNTAIGALGDNEAGLLKAIQYLKSGGV